MATVAWTVTGFGVDVRESFNDFQNLCGPQEPLQSFRSVSCSSTAFTKVNRSVAVLLASSTLNMSVFTKSMWTGVPLKFVRMGVVRGQVRVNENRLVAGKSASRAMPTWNFQIF